MKIWYQSLFDGGRMPAYFEGMKKRARQVARPGVEVEFHGMPGGAYGDKLPSDVARHPYLMSLHIQFTLDNALRAEAGGYDAFAIGSVQDPGIEEARSLVDIPVVGYGEAAMHFACLLGSRFAVVVFGEGFDQMMDLRVKRLGLAERALPSALMHADFSDVARAFEKSDLLVESFSQTARRLIAQGAEAIIPGQLYLSEAIARAGVTRIDEVPIVDGLTATLKMAEAMADMKRQGIAVTRRGFIHARPSREMIDQARQAHGRPDLSSSKKKSE